MGGFQCQARSLRKQFKSWSDYFVLSFESYCCSIAFFLLRAPLIYLEEPVNSSSNGAYIPSKTEVEGKVVDSKVCICMLTTRENLSKIMCRMIVTCYWNISICIKVMYLNVVHQYFSFNSLFDYVLSSWCQWIRENKLFPW